MVQTEVDIKEDSEPRLDTTSLHLRLGRLRYLVMQMSFQVLVPDVQVILFGCLYFLIKVK